jgi:GNAT superfamily N-acetyltransferase
MVGHPSNGDTMSEVKIRKATENDIDATCRLYFEFHQFHVAGVPDRLVDLGDPGTYDYSKHIERIKEVIKKSDSDIFFAEVDGEAIGAVELEFTQVNPENPFFIHHKFCFVEGLMVTEKYRRKGIGQILMDVAYKWSKEKGATEVRLDVWEFPDGPLQFYEKLGFKTMQRTLLKKL